MTHDRTRCEDLAMPGQLDIVDMLAAQATTKAVAPRTADLLDLIAGDPLHADDRARIVAAILADADTHHGTVDPNRVREALAGEHGLTLYPRVLSAVYSSLCHKGVLVRDGMTTNTDTAGGNAGKYLRTYRLTNRRAAA